MQKRFPLLVYTCRDLASHSVYWWKRWDIWFPDDETDFAGQNKMYVQIECNTDSMYRVYKISIYRYGPDILFWCCIPANSRRILACMLPKCLIMLTSKTFFLALFSLPIAQPTSLVVFRICLCFCLLSSNIYCLLCLDWSSCIAIPVRTI